MRRKSLEQMRAFFRAFNGTCINECDGPNGSTFYFYNVNGYLILVQVFGEGGWTHWYPSKVNKLDKAEEELIKFLEEK